MRNFIVKSIIFMVFPVLFFGINMLLNNYFYNNQTFFIKDTKILIAGDSHSQKSLNPKFFNNAKNIAQPAEPYIITYWKLKYIFSQSSNIIDTLILGFAPHNISQFNDLKFSKDNWSSEMFKRSYPIEELNKIPNNISIDYSSFYKVLWKQTGFYPKRNHTNFIGSYKNKKTSDISDWNTAIQRHYFFEGKELGVSDVSINYLDSIVDLCDSKKMELVLVSHPVYEKYLKSIPSVIINKYSTLEREYDKKHIVYNQTDKEYPDSLYLNSDHLNEYGAERFSKELVDFLKKQ